MRTVNLLVVALAVVPVMCSLTSPAWADTKQARGHTVPEGYQLQLLTDRNRDGKINDEKDDETQNFYPDQTLPSRPYVFWINNDFDVVNDDGNVVFDRKKCNETPPDGVDEQFKQRCEQWDQHPGPNASNTAETNNRGVDRRGDMRTSSGLQVIESTRDLEDFSPLKLHMEGLTALYEHYRQHPSRQLVLRVRAVNVGINLFHGLWNDAGEDQMAHSYVYDYGQQAAQVEDDLHFTHLKKNQNWQTFSLSDEWFAQRFDRERDELRFIFEGVSPSANQCHARENDGEISIDSSDCYIEAELVLQYKDSDKVAQPFVSTRLYMDLHDVKDFYDHYTAGNIENDTGEGNFNPEPPHAIRVDDEGGERKQDLFYGIAPSEVIEQDYVMLVHGWRMKKQEKIGFAETAFKRLYWSGYQGRFGMLSWPTGWFDKPAHIYDTTALALKVAGNTQNYNESEIVARQTGVELLEFIPTLKGQNSKLNIHLVAHSMGNVVVSEMLRNASSGIVTSYSASQSAEAAGAFDNDSTPDSAICNSDDTDNDLCLLVNHKYKPVPVVSGCGDDEDNELRAEYAWRCYDNREKDHNFAAPYDMPHDRYQYPKTPANTPNTSGEPWLGPSIGEHYQPYTESTAYYESAENQESGFNGLNFINFYNADDAALTAWELNQLTKPDYADVLGGDSGWDYSNETIDILKSLKDKFDRYGRPYSQEDIIDLGGQNKKVASPEDIALFNAIMAGTWHENNDLNERYLNASNEVPWTIESSQFNLDNARILAHATPARTEPAGQVNVEFNGVETAAPLRTDLNGEDWEFRDSNQGHSAQFYSSYAVQKVYWRQILDLSLGFDPFEERYSGLYINEEGQ